MHETHLEGLHQLVEKLFVHGFFALLELFNHLLPISITFCLMALAIRHDLGMHHDLTSLTLSLYVPWVFWFGLVFINLLLQLHFLINLVNDVHLNHIHELKPPPLLFEVTHLFHKCHLDLKGLLPFLEQRLLVEESYLYLAQCIEKPLFLLVLVEIATVVLHLMLHLSCLVDKVIVYFYVLWVLNLHCVHTFDKVKAAVFFYANVVLGF